MVARFERSKTPNARPIFRSRMTAIPNLPSVRWKLELSGEGEELRGLAKMFAPNTPPPPVRVWVEDGRHYVHADEFEGMSDYKAVLALGDRLVKRLNGLGVLKFGWFRPVTLGTLLQPTPTGGQNVFVNTGPITFRVSAPSLLA